MTIGVSSTRHDERVKIILALRSYRSRVADYQACCDVYKMMYPSGVQSITDMPSCRSDTYEPERWAERRLDQRAMMDRHLETIRQAYVDIESLIGTLLNIDAKVPYHAVLNRRYILNQSWEQIAVMLHCGRATAIRWHDVAIDILAEQNLRRHETREHDLMPM